MEPAVPLCVCGAEACLPCVLPFLVAAEVGGDGEGEEEGEGEGDDIPPDADPSEASCGGLADGVELREQLDIENCGISSPNLGLSLPGGATEEGPLNLSGTWIIGALLVAVWRLGTARDCVLEAESDIGPLLILGPWCLVEELEVLVMVVVGGALGGLRLGTAQRRGGRVRGTAKVVVVCVCDCS